MFDPTKIGEMLQQARQLQEQIQSNLSDREVVGEAGAGMVKVTLNGRYEATEIVISPELIKNGDVEMVQDLVKAAVNAAAGKMQNELIDQAKDLAGKFGLGG